MFCLNCKSVFSKDETATYEEYSEFWGSTVSEHFNCCPYCNSLDITDKEPVTCCCCDEYCTYDFIETADNKYYCENCYQIQKY